jgi:hypothetical protein
MLRGVEHLDLADRESEVPPEYPYKRPARRERIRFVLVRSAERGVPCAPISTELGLADARLPIAELVPVAHLAADALAVVALDFNPSVAVANGNGAAWGPAVQALP